MVTTTAESIRRYTGPALFSFGFRPFFLFASIWSAMAVPIWVGALLGGSGVVGRDWHVHEMLFGYLGGVVAGFLLTAVPNWTGRLPVTGWRLAGLFGLWLAGRVVSLAPFVPPALAAVVDSAFFVVFAAVVWREVIAGKNRRNLPVCAMVSLLAVADVAFQLRGVVPSAGPVAERGALAVAAGLICLIGGRIVPSFTQNWLAARRIAPGPVAFNRFDQVVLTVTGAALASWVVVGDAGWVGILLVAAGLANAARLARWRGWKAAAEPLVWILHAGYLWVAVGLLLLGAALIVPTTVPRTAGVHGLTAGAIGVMTLAVMTRATLGHTGRDRIADRATLLIYLAVILGAAIRVAAPFAGAWTSTLLIVSATLWSLAFTGFALRYGPMLATPRRAA
ncbi:MAG: NnrS family protein [Parcubacteria group bacterium]